MVGVSQTHVGDDKWRIDTVKEIINIKQTVLELAPAEEDDDSFLTSDQ